MRFLISMTNSLICVSFSSGIPNSRSYGNLNHGQISPWLVYNECSHELLINMSTWTVEYSGLSLLDTHWQSWRDVARVSYWTAPPFDLIVGGVLQFWLCCSKTRCTILRTGLIWSSFLALHAVPMGPHNGRYSFPQRTWLFLRHQYTYLRSTLQVQHKPMTNAPDNSLIFGCHLLGMLFES